MQYNPQEMSRKIKNEIDHKIKNGKIKAKVGVELSNFYEACLHDYTYLKNGNNQ